MQKYVKTMIKTLYLVGLFLYPLFVVLLKIVALVSFADGK
jgi:hypothetical protein